MAKQEAGAQDIFHNQWIEEPEVYKAPLVAMMSTLDTNCFDGAFYRAHNKDLAALPEEQLWPHYCSSGQFEQRPVRCVLAAPLSTLLEALCDGNGLSHEAGPIAHEHLPDMRCV